MYHLKDNKSMDIARLFDCPLCTGIPEREREQFIEGFDYSVKSYMKGEVVFRQGDVCRFLYILLEGGSRGGNDG